MRTLTPVFFLIFAWLEMATSQGYLPRQTNDLSTSEQFFHDVHTVAHDLQESVLLQNKAVIDAVAAIAKAKFGILKDIKGTDNQFVSNLVDAQLANLEAIKNAKLAFIKKLANKITTLLDEVQDVQILDLLQLPLFDYLGDMSLSMLPSLTEKTDHAKGNDANPVIGPEDSRPHENSKISSMYEYLNKYPARSSASKSPSKL